MLENYFWKLIDKLEADGEIEEAREFIRLYDELSCNEEELELFMKTL